MARGRYLPTRVHEYPVGLYVATLGVVDKRRSGDKLPTALQLCGGMRVLERSRKRTGYIRFSRFSRALFWSKDTFTPGS